jgi:hypothetical protein
LAWGAVRIPKVQDLLKKYLEIPELGWHLNGDEAMAHGAAMFGANISDKAELKDPLWLEDVSTYDILVDLSSKHFQGNQTVLFPAGTPLGQGSIASWRRPEEFFVTLTANYSGSPYFVWKKSFSRSPNQI